ncbi:MAG: hypothetical protein HYV03_06790 [Deltaproteobacteria bacterium]|nr:hypothetical protein [Deltaproteobacteria bacterium]
MPSSDVPSDPPKGDVPARDVIAAVFKGLIKAVRPGIEEAFELVRSSAGSRHADQFAYRLGDLLKEMQLLKIRFPGTPEKIEKG